MELKEIMKALHKLQMQYVGKNVSFKVGYSTFMDKGKPVFYISVDIHLHDENRESTDVQTFFFGDYSDDEERIERLKEYLQAAAE